jgi:hypothetical protein
VSRFIIFILTEIKGEEWTEEHRINRMDKGTFSKRKTRYLSTDSTKSAKITTIPTKQSKK